MYEQLYRVLRSMAPVPDEELKYIRPLFRPVSLGRGQFFVRAGEVPQTLGFVVSGLLRLYYLDDAGNEFTKSFRMEHTFVAAYSALLLGEPSRLFIEALEDTVLLVASYEAYRSLADETMCWQIVSRRLAESLFINKEKRESELVLDDAATRYQRFLAEYPGLASRLKQYQIASYLGITPVTLSRIRAQLQREKLT